MTAEAVGEALLDFPIPIKEDVTLGWIATAVRRGLALTIPEGSNDPTRESNAEVRDRLNKLATRLRSVWRDAFTRDEGIDDLLFWSAFRRWGGQNALGTARDPDFEFNRLAPALEQLEWLTSYFERAAKDVEPQQKNWRLTQDKEWRVARGQVLAPIFEHAFGKPVTVNRFRYDPRFKEATPFMVFYERMVTLAFGNVSDLNLPEVLQEARRRHLEDPWRM